MLLGKCSTLKVLLSSQVYMYKQLSSNLNGEVSQHPIQGGVEIPLVTSFYTNGRYTLA